MTHFRNTKNHSALKTFEFVVLAYIGGGKYQNDIKILHAMALIVTKLCNLTNTFLSRLSLGILYLTLAKTADMTKGN